MHPHVDEHSDPPSPLADPVAFEAAIRASERLRIAREVHDELGEVLTALHFETAHLKELLNGQEAALAAVGRVQRLLSRAASAKRRTLRDLTSPLREGMPLEAAARELCQRFARSSGLAVRRRLRRVQASVCAGRVMYGALQECLSNIGQHARASLVEVSLGQARGRVVLTVRDDGRGFDPARLPHDTMGLPGVLARVRDLQGVVHIESRADAGTFVRIELPAGGAGP